MLKHDIEQQILSNCCRNRNFARDAIAILTPQDFFDSDQHSEIFRALIEIMESQYGFGNAAMIESFERHSISRNTLKNLLSKPVVPEEDFVFLINKLKEINDRARIQEFALRLEGLSQDVTADMSHLRNTILTAADVITPANMRGGNSISVIGDEFVSALDEPTDKILTGLFDIDRTLGGLAKGEVSIWAARPGLGKTSLALVMCHNMARNGKPAAYYCFEMSKDKMYEKIMAHHGNIPHFVLDKKPKEGIDTFRHKILTTKLDLDKLPIHMYDETVVPNLDKLEDSIRFEVGRYGTEVVFVDYLQLVSVPGIYNDEFKAVSSVSRRLKKLAKSCNIHICAISQMSRDQDKGEHRLPRNSDLRSSGQIEQDAAYIFFVVNRNFGVGFEEKLKEVNIKPPYLETGLYLTKNRFSGGRNIMFDTVTFFQHYSKYANVVWARTDPRRPNCPQCGSPHIRYKKGTISCSSCSYSGGWDEDSVGGFIFRTQEVNMYGHNGLYDFGFVSDGYQGLGVLADIQTVNSMLTPEDGVPIKFLKSVSTSYEMEPMAVDAPEGDILDGLL